MENEISLRIILERPPANVVFGLQKGSGRTYETIQKQQFIGQDLEFEFSIKIKPKKDLAYNFSGEFVQGPADERFIYLDIGACAGQVGSAWSRRLKIPLRDISSQTIETLISDPSQILQTRVPGTGKDNGPNCATVKPFDGWKLALKK